MSILVRMNQGSSHWTNFLEILYWVLLRKSVEKIQIYKSWAKNGTLYTKTKVRFIVFGGTMSP